MLAFNSHFVIITNKKKENMAQQLITNEDYQILGITKNAEPDEIRLAYERLCLQWHPTKIRKEKLREPNELELKEYKKISEVYKKFNFYWRYICEGRNCHNEFYPCLWKKDGHYFCSCECLADYEDNKENNERQQEAKAEWEKTKSREIENIKYWLLRNNAKTEDLEPKNRNYQEQINNVGEEWSEENYKKILDIREQVEKDICRKERDRNSQKCDHCHGPIGEIGFGYIDSSGNIGSFCSEQCREKWASPRLVRKWKPNILELFLKWMEQEGIEQIKWDANKQKIVVIKSGNQTENYSPTENGLSPQLVEVGRIFQENSTQSQSFSRGGLQEELNKSNLGNNSNKGLPPALIAGGIVVLVAIVLMGLIAYKKRKK